MSKNALLVLCFLCFCSILSAQVAIGISSGPNMTFWKWEKSTPTYNEGLNPDLGLRTTLFAEWKYDSIFGGRFELGTQIKSNQKEVFQGESFKPSKRQRFYQYWEASFLTQVYPSAKVRGLYLMAGVTAGKLFSAWEKFTGPVDDYKSPIAISDKNVYNQYAMLFDIGLGTNMPIGVRGSIKLEGRFQYMPSQILAPKYWETRANSIILSIGYLYQI